MVQPASAWGCSFNAVSFSLDIIADSFFAFTFTDFLRYQSAPKPLSSHICIVILLLVSDQTFWYCFWAFPLLCFFLCILPLWRNFCRMRARKIFSAHICPWCGKKHVLVFGGEAAVLALHVKDLNRFTGLCCWSSCAHQSRSNFLVAFHFVSLLDVFGFYEKLIKMQKSSSLLRFY